MRGRFCLRLALLCLLSAPAWTGEFFVSPEGTARGDGSLERPWDLATALAQPRAVRPMDTIWLRGGVYRGAFTSLLRGAPNLPVIVKQYPGERAIIDGREGANKPALSVQGEWTWYWGFEVANSRTDRRIEVAGSNPVERPGTSVEVQGKNLKFINLVVHDGSGYGFWKPAVNSEIYGNLIYNNGWLAPDQSNGHGIYTQNAEGRKVIEDNIIFNQFGNGMQIYGSESASLRNYLLKGNVHFNDRFLVGGLTPAENVEVVENFLYKNTAEFGYTNRANRNLILLRNYFAVQVVPLFWDRVRAEGNTFYRTANAAVEMRLAPDGKPGDHFFDGNVYYSTSRNPVTMRITATDLSARDAYTFAELREKLGFEAHGQNRVFEADRPPEPAIFVRRNKYEPSRGHIIVYNWPRRDAVEADISVMNVRSGDTYELRNAQNYFEEAISGTLDGETIRVPMTGWTIARPIGLEQPIEPATFPEFGVFVITVRKAARLSDVSAASFRASPLAPDSIVAAFGDDLLPAGAADPASVHVRDSSGAGRLAPLLFASPRQVNYVLPAGTAFGPALVSISNGEAGAADEGILVAPLAPGLFAAGGAGNGVAAAEAISVNPDGTRISQPVYECAAGGCAPVPIEFGPEPGELYLALYGTGLRGSTVAEPVSVAIGGEPAEVVFAGPHPTLAGVDQVNVKLPRKLAGRGAVDLVLSVGTQSANTVTVAIR